MLYERLWDVIMRFVFYFRANRFEYEGDLQFNIQIHLFIWFYVT